MVISGNQPAVDQETSRDRAVSLRRPRLKVAWLAYFIEVSRKGQLAPAAQVLGITVQALKRNLDQLEAHLALQLVRYSGRWVQLTPGGEDFLAEAFELFYALRRLSGPEPLRPPQQMQGLRLGWARCWLQSSPVALCGQIRGILPEHRLEIQALVGQRKLEQSLVDGRLDLALLWASPASALLTATAGAASPFQIVSAPQPLRSWDSWSYAVPEAGLADLQPWRQERYPRRIQFETGSFSALLDAAVSGLCAVYLPECLIQAQLSRQQLAIVAEPPEAHRIRPWLCWRADTQNPELAQLVSGLRRLGWGNDGKDGAVYD